MILILESNSNITDKYKLLSNNDLHSKSTIHYKDSNNVALKVTQLKLQKFQTQKIHGII